MSFLKKMPGKTNTGVSAITKPTVKPLGVKPVKTTIVKPNVVNNAEEKPVVKPTVKPIKPAIKPIAKQEEVVEETVTENNTTEEAVVPILAVQEEGAPEIVEEAIQEVATEETVEEVEEVAKETEHPKQEEIQEDTVEETTAEEITEEATELTTVEEKAMEAVKKKAEKLKETKAEKKDTTTKKKASTKKTATKKEEAAEAVEYKPYEMPTHTVRENYDEVVSKLIVYSLGQQWEENVRMIEEQISSIQITPDMNAATLKQAMADLIEIREAVWSEYTSAKTIYESICEKDGKIDVVKSINSRGTNAEERKFNAYTACVNHNFNGQLVNLFELAECARTKYNFYSEVIKQIEFKKGALITMNGAIKLENSTLGL